MISFKDRNDRIRRMVAEGLPAIRVAELFGISRERVRQITGSGMAAHRSTQQRKRLEMDLSTILHHIENGGATQTFTEMARKLNLPTDRVGRVLRKKLGTKRTRELFRKRRQMRCQAILDKFLAIYPDAALTQCNIAKVMGSSCAAYLGRYNNFRLWRMQYGQPEQLSGNSYMIRMTRLLRSNAIGILPPGTP